MNHFALSLRLATRRLRATPWFTAAAILTLALGIGANTVVFSVVQALVLRPFQVDKPEQLVFLNVGGGTTMSYPDYRDFRDRNRSLAGLIAYRLSPVNLNEGGRNARTWAYLATGNYFDVLGVKPALGRLFTQEDDRKPNGHPLVVLSYGCWQRRFGSDPGVAGRAIRVNGYPYTILGVAPRGFRGTEIWFAPDFWIPMAMEAQIEPGNPWLEERSTMNIWTVGRRKPDLGPAPAQADLNVVAAQIAREHPATREGMRIVLSRPGLLGNMMRGPVTSFSAVLMGVTGLVLLIACVNLAGLLLARASDRRRDIALRLAIGAGRGQIVRELLTETLLLSMAGAAGALLLTAVVGRALSAFRSPINVPVEFDVSAGAPVFVAAFGLCLLAALAAGLAPAIRSARTDLAAAIKNDAASDRLRRWHARDILVMAQVGLSVMLLVASAVVVRGLRHALDLNLGYDPSHTVAACFDLDLQGYRRDQAIDFQRRALEAVRSIPGVESAGLINAVPLSIDVSHTTIYVEGRAAPRASDVPSAIFYQVSPGYFHAARTRLLAGRDFTDRDTKDGPQVAIINRAFARQIMGSENALGKRYLGGPGGSPVEIVGIVEDGKYASLSESAEPVVFRPFAQQSNGMTTVVARSPLPAPEILRALQARVLQLDPLMTLFDMRTLEEHLNLPLFPARAAAAALGAFGLLTIVLAATGVYGALAYAVSRRTREIGIRVAVGATAGDVLRMVLRRTAVLLGIGLPVGLAAAYAAAGVLTYVAYGVNPRDPMSLGVAAGVMIAVGLAASWAPARRALSVDPATALRHD